MPPRSKAEAEKLLSTARELQSLAPAFICVTCHAGQHEETLALVHRMKRDIGFEAMAHLVCNGMNQSDVHAFLAKMRTNGLVNILALRGDPGPQKSLPHNNLKHATDLISIIKTYPGFSVGAACYPEGHIESTDRRQELYYTRKKVEAGASFLITQLFLENSHYFRFVEEARSEGIEVPIIPGIMPITNAKQLARVKKMGVSVPVSLERDILARADDPQAVAQFGVAWASLQCTSLLAAGAPGIHFYTFQSVASYQGYSGSVAVCRAVELGSP